MTFWALIVSILLTLRLTEPIILLSSRSLGNVEGNFGVFQKGVDGSYQ